MSSIKRIKKSIVGQNMYLCNHGELKELPMLKSLKAFYNPEMKLDPPINYCKLEVRPTHPLTIAKEFVSKGMKPIIANIVTSEFNGECIETSAEMLDDIINMRTNYYKTLANSMELFPLENGEVTYAPLVYVIRDENMQLQKKPYLYRMGVLTGSLTTNPLILGNSMNFNDYCKCFETINAIFQVGSTNHDVLILSDFGSKEGIPVCDIIDIYNSCILKYGHMYKYIIIGINILSKADMYIYTKCLNDIYDPQQIIHDDNDEKQKKPKNPNKPNTDSGNKGKNNQINYTTIDPATYKQYI